MIIIVGNSRSDFCGRLCVHASDLIGSYRYPQSQIPALIPARWSHQAHRQVGLMYLPARAQIVAVLLMSMGDTRFFTYPLRYPLSFRLWAVAEERWWTLEDWETAEGWAWVSVRAVGLRRAYCSINRSTGAYRLERAQHSRKMLHLHKRDASLGARASHARNHPTTIKIQPGNGRAPPPL